MLPRLMCHVFSRKEVGAWSGGGLEVWGSTDEEPGDDFRVAFVTGILYKHIKGFA